ncbi:MAG TPA: ATP-binding protein [Thermomicrobiales bacterium]|nr:ATP-binding protein [Thermomicrobiales bacterium]
MESRRLTDQQFADLVTLRYELRGIEFKGIRPRTDRLFFARVARACLGMANLRDGGRVVIGVDERGGAFDPVGLSDTDLDTWRYDDVAAGLASYADPALSFDLHIHEYQGKQFIVLEVHEFDDLPVLCKMGYTDYEAKQPVLRAGACYVRSRRKPETSEIPSQAEMRELLDLAIEKGLRRFLARARAVGLELPGQAPSGDRERFERQLRDVEGNRDGTAN